MTQRTIRTHTVEGARAAIALIVALGSYHGRAHAQQSPAVAMGATVDSLIRVEMSTRRLPGLALAVVRDGQVVFARGYGFADIERQAPVSVETRFQIASITKSFTALATMQLVEQGRVAMDDQVGRYLPQLPEAWHAVTVRQLLAHTSGIPSISAFERPPCPTTKSQADYVLGDVLAEVACLPLAFPPGERWEYGDTNYYLLGLLIAAVSGMSYEAFLSQGILTPLGMTATRLQRRTPEADVAQGYRWQSGRFEAAPSLDPIVDEANGALVSTVRDLARLDAALYGEQLLPRRTLATMWTPAETREGLAPYGLGFGLTPFRGKRRVGHTGGAPGSSTAISRFPDERLTVILLSNGEQPPGKVLELAHAVAALFLTP
ncbi:MAG: beta-lactamase family protein [Gemmatimonadaceae bacterium]|nr:beta-lactamase family protein [Gemmatimonadaceae bacterium]MBX9857803.1 beta-lactamase family protein [Gemmatimonadaceae bacterium]